MTEKLDDINNFSDKIAIGPLVGLPSSDWVGEDVANYLLSQHCKIEKFNDFNKIGDVDYIIVVKLMPSLEWLLEKINLGVKVLYAPVDIFHSQYVYWQYKAHLKLFSGFLIHNVRVGDLIRKTTDSPQFFIEHYLKYHIKREVTPNRSQELLWVGHLEYIPALLQFIKESKPDLSIRALSDLEKLPHYENYLEKSLLKIGHEYSIVHQSDNSVLISGVLVEQWSEEKQSELMRTCSAAFDTKMNSFAHNLKPPTKAQKFIYNKIPFACSEYSFSYEYFHKLGLNVAKLNELNYLMSDEYQKLVEDFCDTEDWRVKIENVSKSYVDSCLKSTLPKSTSKYYFYFIGLIYFITYFSLRIVDKLKSVFTLIKSKG